MSLLSALPHNYEIRADFNNGGPTGVLINSFQILFKVIIDPIFSTENPSDQTLFKSIASTVWEYQLPAFDSIQNGQAVSLSIDVSCCAWLTLDNDTLRIADISDPLIPIGPL